jgi:hypothetical protein
MSEIMNSDRKPFDDWLADYVDEQEGIDWKSDDAINALIDAASENGYAQGEIDEYLNRLEPDDEPATEEVITEDTGLTSDIPGVEELVNFVNALSPEDRTKYDELIRRNVIDLAGGDRNNPEHQNKLQDTEVANHKKHDNPLAKLIGSLKF